MGEDSLDPGVEKVEDNFDLLLGKPGTAVSSM